jgi:hypothetical protein
MLCPFFSKNNYVLMQYNKPQKDSYTHFDSALHDMLSIILDRINILKVYNFKDLYVCINKKSEDKLYPIQLYKFKYDNKKKILIDEFTNTELDELANTEVDEFIELEESTKNNKLSCDFLCYHNSKPLLEKINKLLTKDNYVPIKSPSQILAENIKDTLEESLPKNSVIFNKQSKMNIVKEKNNNTNNVIINNDENQDLDQDLDQDQKMLVNDMDSDNPQFIAETMKLLQEQMKTLKEKKEREQKKLNNHKEIHKNDVDTFVDLSCDVRHKENLIKKENEKKSELKRIFESDKKIFLKMKEQLKDIEHGLTKDNIPKGFVNKYNVFETLHAENQFDNKNCYEAYRELIDSSDNLESEDKTNNNLEDKLNLNNNIVREKVD